MEYFFPVDRNNMFHKIMHKSNVYLGFASPGLGLGLALSKLTSVRKRTFICNF